jgi:hypothetical protein
MEYAGKTGFPGFGNFGRATTAPWGAKTAPRGKMQLAGSKDGGWVYTEPDPGVQNGNSG